MVLALATAATIRALAKPSEEGAKLSRMDRLAVALAAFTGGVLGAKLPFVLVSGSPIGDPASWLTDGKTIVAGLAGGYLAVELTKLARGIQVKTGDDIVIPLAASLVVGRWGCFFAGCCAGAPTDVAWGMPFGDGVLRHPTQLYEVAFHATMLGLLLDLQRRDALRFQRIKLYLIAYGTFRFFIELVRTEPRWHLGLTVYQWAALALVVPLLVQWRVDAPLSRRTAPDRAGSTPQGA